MQGTLQHLGYTIRDQTVGNILKRQGLSPAPQRKKSVTWQEFTRCHLDVLLATDFFTSEVWSGYGLVISSLLCFLHAGRHNVQVADMTLYDSMRRMLPVLLWSLNVPTSMARWTRLVRHEALSRLIRSGTGVRRPPLSAFPTDDDQAPIPQGRGKVVRLPAVHPRPIRDGSVRGRPQLGGLVENDPRKAA